MMLKIQNDGLFLLVMWVGGKKSCVIKDASLRLSSVFSLKPNTLIQEEHIL